MKITAAAIWFVSVTFTMAAFQNCQKASFTSGADAVSMNSFGTDTTYASTEMNTPIDFTLKSSGPLNGVKLNFASPSGSALKGKFEVLDSANFKIRYTPEFGFRGHDKAMVEVSDAYGTKLTLFAIVNVGNPLAAIQPALAVRGMGCIQCHANVSSNIITDFGFGDSFYFGQGKSGFAWNSGAIYGDHGPSFNSMSTAADKSVIVPKGAVPSSVSSATGANTIADYVRGQLSQSSLASTRATTVEEKTSVYIGAPTDADLVSSFNLSAVERSKFYANEESSPALQGVSDQGSYFRISGNIACDGDLVLRGPVYIENLDLNTISGCRLYVIGSVFFFGPLNFSNNEPSRNLQITSTRSISMGLGDMKRDNAFCDPNSQYAQQTASFGTSSLAVRYKTFWTVPANFVRQSADPVAYGASVVAESELIAGRQGRLYDATCRSEGRHLSFERLLINAPIVHSRYIGNFRGTVIAEQATMSLNSFVFEFDPVFSNVPILPFLDPAKYLSVF